MSHVRIVGTEGRAIVITHASPDGHDGWRYEVAFEFETGRAGIGVWDYGEPGLPVVFRKVADQWRGFDDPIEFGSIEGDVHLRFTHDGIGTVNCQATIRQPWPPTFDLTMELSFGAGAHVERIAGELAALFAHPRT